MARPGLKVAFFDNFSGGLNNHESRQNLLPTETPDCQDVVFNNRGGFSSRRGYGTTTVQSALNGGYIGGQFSAGTDVLWGINNAGALWTWDGSTYTNVTTASPADASRVVNGVSWDDRLYFANWLNSGNLLMRFWNGTAFTTLTNTPNNNYTAPTQANAPLARLIAKHSGHMWWADTVESGTRFRSRVRFSHPLQPRDFATADFFDLDPDDQSDNITALVPFKDHILVFKRRSVYAIYGYDRSTFQPERLAGASGVSCQGAVTQNAGVVYWWSIDGNVYAYNGRGVVPIGDRITGILNEGIVAVGCDTTRCMWAEDQLWVSLRKTDLTRVLFVYDPSVGENGAWTRFSYAPTSMFWWKRSTGAPVVFFTLLAEGMLFDLSNLTKPMDTKNGVDTPVDAYYKTAWFTAKDTALKKRWRRPTVAVAAEDDCMLNVDVYHDFNESSINRTLLLPIQSSTGGMVWGDDWGSIWGGDDPVYEFDRLSSPGRSNAIQFKFRVTDVASRWWVDSFALPYFEKNYR
jgi:hypothetical protein